MTPKQTCRTCPSITKCWGLRTFSGKPISAQNVYINVLICRLQLGIRRDEAAKLLIQAYKPGMVKLINTARQKYGLNPEETNQLLMDMQSTMIEYLTNDYKIGDRGRATPYLFDPQQGFLTKWIRWIVNKNRKFYLQHEFLDQAGEGNLAEQDPEDDVVEYSGVNEPTIEHEEASDFARTVMDIIDDGLTLSYNEYRVLKFCLSYANDSKSIRHIDGLHIKLGNILGVSRPRITRLYARARQKIQIRYAQLHRED